MKDKEEETVNEMLPLHVANQSLNLDPENYEEKRSKRSAEETSDNDLINVNIVMSAVNIALLCIFTVILGGLLKYIDRENVRNKTEKHEAVMEQINKKHTYITGRVNEFHAQHKEIYVQLQNEIKGRFDMMITMFQEICKNTRLNTPYPMRLTRGHTNEDFANMVRITHWNGQWRDNNNTSLSPSAFLQCPQDLPKPQHHKEWQRLARLFYEESGVNILMPRYSDIEDMENLTYTPTMDIDHLDTQQLCRTPVCFNPNVKYEGKESKCQYCTQVCCNCLNCTRFRGFFKIRTALINTGKIDSWDHYNQQLIKSINHHNLEKREKKTLEDIIKVLYQQAREQQPSLPLRLTYMDDEDPLKEKLKNMALRMMDGPVDKIITADERTNRLADDLSEEILLHFLKTKELQKLKTQDIMKWLLDQYHDEEELTKGGSDVVVKFDYNMDKQESSQEAKQGSTVELNWLGSATDDEDNVSIECGYESVD